jgi:predicted aspartyl protease
VSPAFTSASVKGEKGHKDISGISIDPSIFFTTLPTEVLFEVGASSEHLKARLELKDGSIVEAPIFSVIVSAHGRENVTLATTYEGALPIVGAKFLEDFGLKMDSESGSLAPTRHAGFSYNFEP